MRRQIAALTLAGVAVAGCGGTTTAEKTAAPPAASVGDSGEATAPESPADAAAPAKVGAEGFTYESGLQVYVTSLKRHRLASGAYGHKAGNVGVIATVKIVNKTRETLDLSSATVDMRAGADGVSAPHISDFGPGVDIGLGFTGRLAPGRTATAQQGFDVAPADLKLLTVQVTPDFVNHEAVLFDGKI